VLDDLTHGFTWVDVADKTIRTIAVYGTLLLLLRLAGRRQIGQLSTFDFVVILLLSNVVQNAIIGPDNTLIGGLIGAAILVGINFLVAFFVWLNPSVERDLRGTPRSLVEHGQPKAHALRRELITKGELNSALRRQGYSGLDAVEEVVLEPEGTLDVVPKRHVTIDEVLAALERIEGKLDRR
jgi:uncharacterized membrane protein YcaP (DUF421 family)